MEGGGTAIDCEEQSFAGAPFDSKMNLALPEVVNRIIPTVVSHVPHSGHIQLLPFRASGQLTSTSSASCSAVLLADSRVNCVPSLVPLQASDSS